MPGPAGFHLLDIENVVDESYQALAVGVCDRDQTARGRRQIAGRVAHKKAERAGDRGQRRAQLMAHRRDEFVFQAFQALAFGGIAERPQNPAHLDLAFDEIVLGTFLQGLLGHRFVVQGRQHHEGGTGRGSVGAAYRAQSLRIGQSRVEQNDVDRMARQINLGRTHAVYVRQFDIVRAVIFEHFAEHAHVSGIIFNQENCFEQFRGHLHSALRRQLDCCRIEAIDARRGASLALVATLAHQI
jgi:hypothetical protein